MMTTQLQSTYSAPGSASAATISERLRQALLDSGMSQVELARKLVGPDASDGRVESMRRLLSKWLRGKHSPTDEYGRRLAELLDTSPDYFIVRPRQGARAAAAPDDFSSDPVSIMWQAVSFAPAATRLKPLPKNLDRKAIARELAMHFEESHILLDHVDAYVAGESASARATLSDEVWALGHWYKDSRMIPGLLILEALAQTASVALLTDPRYRGRIVLCAGYDHVRLKRVVESGDELILTATLRDRSRGQIAHFDADARRSATGELVARGSFTLAVH